MIATITQFLNGWLVGAVFFLFIFLGFLSGLVRAIQSRGWPRTPGKVIESKVERSATSSESGSESYRYSPLVRYTYAVEGKTLESKQIAVGVISGSEAGAEAVVAKYPVNAQVTVYYHPGRPYLAVLEPGRFVLPLVAALVSGAVCYLVVATWTSKSLHPHKGPWDDARSRAAAAKP